MNDSTFTRDLVSGKTLARLGLGLVLLGIVFLYRWGIEQGVITPLARVAVGVLLSGGLLAFGWMTRGRRPLYSALLQGGGVAGLFVSAFAAHAVYDLTSQTAVFVQLVFVSTLAVGLAVTQRIETLAIVGVIGALAAPQMVGGTIDMFPGDAGYVAVVLLGVGVVLYHFDWRWLYGTAAVASGLTLAVELTGLLGGWSFTGPEALVAYTAAFLALWGAPVARLAASRPQHATTAMVATVTIPIAAFFGAWLAWPSASQIAFGAGAAVLAISMAAVYATLREVEAFVATLHLLPASVLAVTSVALMLDGPSLTLAIAAQGVGFVFVGRHIGVKPLAGLGGILYALSAVATVGLLVTDPTTGIPAVNGVALARLGVIALAAVLAVPFLHEESTDQRSIGQVLLAYAHLAFLGWGMAELSRTAIGQPAVSALWGAYALAIVTAGWSRSRMLRNVGLGTLLVTVAKVFLIDMDNASGGAKILLLMGFGMTLLALGYLMPSTDDTEARGRDADGGDDDSDHDPNGSADRPVVEVG